MVNVFFGRETRRTVKPTIVRQESRVWSTMSTRSKSEVYSTTLPCTDDRTVMGGGVITRRPEQMRTRESQKRKRSSFVKIRLHVLSEACDNAERLVRGLRGIGSVDVESLAGPWSDLPPKFAQLLRRRLRLASPYRCWYASAKPRWLPESEQT